MGFSVYRGVALHEVFTRTFVAGCFEQVLMSF